ncbi:MULTISPECIES: DUF397 domain-containing protein [unclassified Streptomyces]|uniref:DUF397 domain-containing protein n=1 Tax=unclassified Streptomyces TaxID=2593676 RepID=UPI00382CF4BD
MSREKDDPYAAPLDGKWVKSSRSVGNGAACVRVMKIEGGVALDDSKSPDRPALRYTDEEMRAFILAAKDGEFDFLLDS